MTVARPLVRRVVSGTWKENTFLVRSPDLPDGVVIDPGCDVEAVDAAIADLGMQVRGVLLTHAHYDHVWGAAHLQDRLRVPLFIHESDVGLLRRVNAFTLVLGLQHIPVPSPTHLLRGGEVVPCGSLPIEVLHLPGHTKGSVAFVIGRDVFVGDTVLPSGVGRTDLPGSDQTALPGSVRRLVEALDDESVVHPGHGPDMSRHDVIAADGPAGAFLDQA